MDADLDTTFKRGPFPFEFDRQTLHAKKPIGPQLRDIQVLIHNHPPYFESFDRGEFLRISSSNLPRKTLRYLAIALRKPRDSSISHFVTIHSHY